MLTRSIGECKWQTAENLQKRDVGKDMLVELHYSTTGDDLMHYWAFALINERRVSMQVPKEVPPISEAILQYMVKNYFQTQQIKKAPNE